MSGPQLEDVQQYAADQAHKVILEYVKAKLEDARSRLETAPQDKFQSVQGEVKALRQLAQDLGGRKTN